MRIVSYLADAAGMMWAAGSSWTLDATGGGPTPPGPPYVQSTISGAAGATGTNNCTFGSAVATGDTVVVGVATDSSPYFFTVTDNFGNTYSPIVGFYTIPGGTVGIGFFQATGVTGGSGLMVTATQTAAPTATVSVAAVDFSSAVHGWYDFRGSSATSTAPNSTTVFNGSTNLMLGLLTFNSSAPVVTAGSGFTVIQSVDWSTSTALYLEIQESLTGNTPATFTLGTSENWACEGVSFN